MQGTYSQRSVAGSQSRARSLQTRRFRVRRHIQAGFGGLSRHAGSDPLSGVELGEEAAGSAARLAFTVTIAMRVT
jgi:hypothetical protein